MHSNANITSGINDTNELFAKVLELQRRRTMEKEADDERRRRDEEEQREQRRVRGIELNHKLQEKESQALGAKAKGKEAPPSLSPVNIGTGDHASYFDFGAAPSFTGLKAQKSFARSAIVFGFAA